MTKWSIWIGYDSRPFETVAFAVTRHSIRRRLTCPIPIRPLHLKELRERGLYTRSLAVKDNKLWDPISQSPMSTEFAISRFLVPFLAKEGWALFLDCDILAQANFANVFEAADRRYAVQCVKHDYRPTASVKMDGQAQVAYPRKNWSSFLLFNCSHPANKRLTLDMVNNLPGRDLHRFCWLEDDEIGELPQEWNFLVGHTDPAIIPKAVHHTEGVPLLPGYENVPYAEEWFAELTHWINYGD